MDVMIFWKGGKKVRREESSSLLTRTHVDDLLASGHGLDLLDLTAIVGTAFRAHSVRLVQSAALRARNERGSGELPVRRTSLITSLTGYFPLGDCHVDTSLKLS